MNRSFARKLSVPVSGVGGLPIVKATGAGADLSGVGAMDPGTASIVTYGLSSAAMFYGVMLAIKGSLLLGGAAFIGGPLVIATVMTKIQEA